MPYERDFAEHPGADPEWRERLRQYWALVRGDLSLAGRRLDFLCQEFTREANTLCSKSFDIQLTRLGLDLKAVIEQFREQVQNVE